MDDTIRKVNEFRRELVAWFEGLLGCFATEGILQAKLSLRANDIVIADVGGAEAAREHR